MGEILAFACGFLRQFEVSSVDGGELQMPAPAPTWRYGGGVEFPATPWRVRLKYRSS